MTIKSRPEQLHALDVVHSSRICCIFRADGRRKVGRHLCALLIILIGLEKLDQLAIVCFIDIEQRIILV